MAGGIPGYKIILNIFISIINFNLAGSVVVIVHPAEVGEETTHLLAVASSSSLLKTAMKFVGLVWN